MQEEQQWWLSELNNQAGVLGESYFPSNLKIYDTTLRDGEQTIGISFDKKEKLEIAKILDEVGVDRIEAGMPVVTKEDKEAVELILKANLKAEIWGFCRALKQDIAACIDVGVKNVIIEIATSSYKMKANKFTREEVMDKAIEALQYAKSHHLYTAFFAVDSTRADLGFLEAIYKKAVEEGTADEVVIVDTLGVATVETMFYLTKRLRQWVDVPVMTHCHNDFGLATACTISSVKGGASYAHVTINGLGEKTGNADLSEIVLAAKLYGIKVNVDFKRLYDAAKLVEGITKIPISPIKPVVGKNVFMRESGVTAAQLIRFPPAVEGYSPEVVGRNREIVLSKKSGRASVEYKLGKLNISATPLQVDEVLKSVKELGSAKKGLVGDSEFEKIVNTVLFGDHSR